MQLVRRAGSDYCIIIPHFDTWITVWIPIVTHWFRLRISVGAVRIHHLEGKNVQESQVLARSPIRPFFAPRWQFWEPITYWEPKFPFWVPIWPFWDDFRKRRGELGGFKCLLAAPVLPPCCHHLDPVKKTAWPLKKKHLDRKKTSWPVPPRSLGTAFGKHTKVVLAFFAPAQKLVCLLIYQLWGCEVHSVLFSRAITVWRLNDSTNQPYIFSEFPFQAKWHEEALDRNHGPLPRSRGPRTPPVVHGARPLQDVGEAAGDDLLPHHVHRQQAYHRHHRAQWVEVVICFCLKVSAWSFNI